MSDRPVFAHRLTVRFRDCDLMGHVNNSVYFTYLEQARLDWWRHLGGDQAFPGVTTVVARAECNYRLPAFLDEELEIRMRVDAVGRSSFTVSYDIVRVATLDRIADCRTVSVTVDPATQRPVTLPDQTRALLERDRGPA